MFLRGLLLLFTTITMAAQTSAMHSKTNTAAPITYELVSIHKSKPEARADDLHDAPEGIAASGVNIRNLLSEAYGFNIGPLLKEQIEGLPGWAESQRFAVEAKVDDSNVEHLAAIRKAQTYRLFVEAIMQRKPTPQEKMLQQLMEDRFHLKMHYEQRVMPVYKMIVANDGVKMNVAHPKDPEAGSLYYIRDKLSGLDGENVPPDFMVFMLSHEVGRPVVDQTNLSEHYDFKLRYAPNNNADTANTGEDNGPSIFTALQEQLGLKLVPAKEPVWIIVVDHVEMPTDN
jgi:uncharacterized protein (TIGR03435 family)